MFFPANSLENNVPRQQYVKVRVTPCLKLNLQSIKLFFVLNCSSISPSDVGFLYCEDNEIDEELLDNESLREILQVKLIT